MRKALRHAGMSVAEMSEYLDVSLASMTAWMSGRTKPRTQTLRLWALRCGVDYSWLATGWPSTLPWSRDEAAAIARRAAEARKAAGLPMDDFSDVITAAEAGMPYEQWLYSEAGIAWLVERGVVTASDPVFLHGNRPLLRKAA